MLDRLRLAAAAALVLALAAPASAQNEQALRDFFEGKRVTLKIDMPGTSDGVDVRVDAARAIDYRDYADRLKEYGTAIRAGDPSMVTLVKLQKDLIEVQLGGGGFVPFGDDAGASGGMRTLEKSSREEDLQKAIEGETDSSRRRLLERELNAIAEFRERENRRIEIERGAAEELERERIAYQRLKGGSRFNLHYVGRVPPAIRPEDVAAALADFVEFAPAEPAASRSTGPVRDVALRKGMLRAEVEHALGAPLGVTDRREGTLTVITLLFVDADRRITAEFVDDVLVRHSVTAKE